jgi:crotonobetaine/carnitine-CoA ligase
VAVSDIAGPSDPQRLMWEMSLGEFLETAVARDPEKVFVEISGQKITYRDFLGRALQTAGMFQALGVGYGDRVCLFLTNCPEFLYCWFGLSCLGAIAVPINTAYKRDETAYILNDAQGVALVAQDSLMPVAAEAAALAPNLKHLLTVAGSDPEANVSPKDDYSGSGWADFGETMTGADPAVSLPSVSPQDISMLVYTSGTTGNPKGVQVSHKMYVAAGQGFAHWTRGTPEDRYFTCLPFYHANIQFYSTMGTLAAGATLIVAERFSASRFWSQVREARASVVNFIGMMMPVLAKQPESPGDTDNQVRLFYGSPAMTPEFFQDFQRRFGTEIIVGFGMTETCYGTIEVIGEPRRPNSSGPPRQHPDPRFTNQMRIAHPETGEPLATGQPGEITIKNPAIMSGYWRNQEQTSQSIRDGWLHTGDLGWLDEDGFLYFVDRKKDIIRRRGENISSQEVEDVIKAHPDVLDCAAIGVPSELGEDEVKVYITSKEGAVVDPADVVRWCAERLAYFKVPRYLEVRDQLPRTPSMRVRKDLLRREKDDLTQDSFDREAAGIRIR